MTPIVVENHPDARQIAHEFADLGKVAPQSMAKHKSRPAPVLFIIEIDIFTVEERHRRKSIFRKLWSQSSFSGTPINRHEMFDGLLE